MKLSFLGTASSSAVSRAVWVALASLTPLTAGAQTASAPPIIDMHLHAWPIPGPLPFRLCPRPEKVLSWDQRQPWLNALGAQLAQQTCSVKPIAPAVSDSDVMARTLAIMRRHNIIGVTSGSSTAAWLKAAPDRIIPAQYFQMDSLTPDSLRRVFASRAVRVFAEVATAYQGISPSDSALESYLSIAEELDVPVGFHVGVVGGMPYLPGSEKFRAAGNNPLLLEEALVRHPRLRVYVMHAGWPFLDATIALLATHPQVYVDLGLLGWGIPRREYHRYVRALVDAGLIDRIMFGSDMVAYPETIEASIDAVKEATYLTSAQQRAIFYDNAARFLRLSDAEIARHHDRHGPP